MKEEKKISITILRFRLSKRMQWFVSQADFATLLYGWRHHSRFHAVSANIIRVRKFRDGKEWFSHQEAVSLSKYAGYDLTTDP